MTNEEAKKILFNQWQTFLDNYIDYAGVSEAYELAIKVLDQELCEDCTNGKAVIDAQNECNFCSEHEEGDTLYECNGWDGGVSYDYIHNIKYCPLCGRKLGGGDDVG